MSSEPLKVERFETSVGVRIYRLPLEAFPDFVVYAFLVLGEGLATLIDVGSGFDQSNRDLLAGFESLRQEHGERVKLADVQEILVTHGHIDHFGGLRFVQQHCSAPIAVHELDLGVLINFEERRVIAAVELRQFLVQTGVEGEERDRIMSMYVQTKKLFSSVEVAFTYESVGMSHGPFRFLHVPGHCPGQVVIQFEDVLFSADHVLSHTTPHQVPESITRYTGLGHYLESLDKVRTVDDVRLTLGGHEDPIVDVAARADAIRRMHEQRLQKILALLSEPKTIGEVSGDLFGEVSGYHVLLALEEAGAHIEYLWQQGQVVIANLDEVDGGEEVPIRYRDAR